jgi:hypothetical protein
MSATCSTATFSLIFHHPDNSLWLMCWTPKAFVTFWSTGSVYDKGLLAACPVPMLEAVISTLFTKGVRPGALLPVLGHHRLPQLKPTHDLLSFLMLSSSSFIKWLRTGKIRKEMQIETRNMKCRSRLKNFTVCAQ